MAFFSNQSLPEEYQSLQYDLISGSKDDMNGSPKTHTLWYTNIAMENGPFGNFEDVFPIENGDIPLLC